ncbi:hypothetical protein [Burkholderia pseudomallei]|uniref:hypothetical protein n=1 Tax=Burkholderia pseudomallei TaxID=28450 RepID=UPI00314002C9
MNEINAYAPTGDPNVGIREPVVSVAKLRWRQILMTIVALLATSVSLGMAMSAGWHLGGLFYERVMYVALFGVVVVYVHLLPTCRLALSGPARTGAAALWCGALMVVFYGQVTFFLISQQHAGDIRAASVPAINVPDHLASRRGRGLAEITQDTAKLTADLVRMKMRRCIADCPMVKARAAIVEAQLAALKTEADEAKRREADEDRWKKALDRNESLRAALRDNSVASRIASWFGTTESKVEFLHAFASAVVLEGAAIVAWMLAAGEQGRRERSVSSGANHRLLAPLTHDGSSPIAQSHGIAAAASEPIATAVEPVAELEMPVGSSKANFVVSASDTGKCADSATKRESEIDNLVAQLERDIAAGLLHPTQEKIRRHLRCSQKKAAELRRLLALRLADQQLAT